MDNAIKVINELEKTGVIQSYAIGGATALLFYTEPTLTFDIDVFVFLPSHNNGQKNIIVLTSLYDELRKQGYSEQNEHVMIEGIPIQFIPVYNKLVEESVTHAIKKKYKKKSVRIIGLEYLLAIMIDTNRPKDRQRISQVLENGTVNKEFLLKILKKHALLKKWESTIGKL